MSSAAPFSRARSLVAASDVPGAARPGPDMAAEVLAGLRAEPKYIAPKYFYDRKGAGLFDAISELDEYYLTRVERRILLEHRAAISAVVGRGTSVVEPGAGSCRKIAMLLAALEPARYIALDISAEHLQASTARLREAFPDVDITGRVCDHTRGQWLDDLLEPLPDAPVLFFYPGSSIGNFEPDAAVGFLGAMRSALAAAGDTGGLLIGVDTKKDEAILDAAYNDRAGITRLFNLNVLDHLNALLGGDLDTGNFAHVAGYDRRLGRVEMHLRCLASHSATLAGNQVEFVAGESIHTENSYKYHPQEFAELAGRAGFRLRELWQDSRAWFSVMYFEPA